MGQELIRIVRATAFVDYDVVYITDHVNEIVQDDDWINQFGEVLIKQLPDYNPYVKDYSVFGYLVHFKDLNRIDLRLMKPDLLSTQINDAYSIVLLDKNNRYSHLNFNRESELYSTKLCSEFEFQQITNEIYWVSTYVIKGIAREDLIYAEFMLSNPVKKAFIELIKQWILTDNNREELNFGKVNQAILNDLKDKEAFIQLYCNQNLEAIEDNVRYIIEQTHRLAGQIAKKQGFKYRDEEYKAVKYYLEQIL